MVSFSVKAQREVYCWNKKTLFCAKYLHSLKFCVGTFALHVFSVMRN